MHVPRVSATDDYFMQARCKAVLQAYDQGDRTNTITALWKCQKVVYSCTDPETGALQLLDLSAGRLCPRNFSFPASLHSQSFSLCLSPPWYSRLIITAVSLCEPICHHCVRRLRPGQPHRGEPEPFNLSSVLELPTRSALSCFCATGPPTADSNPHTLKRSRGEPHFLLLALTRS